MSAHDSTLGNWLRNFIWDNHKKVLKKIRSLDDRDKKDTVKQEEDDEVNDVVLSVSFTSQVLVELHKEDEEYFVHLRYNGEDLQVFDGSNRTKLNNFLDILKGNVDPKFDILCPMNEIVHNKY